MKRTSPPARARERARETLALACRDGSARPGGMRTPSYMPRPAPAASSLCMALPCPSHRRPTHALPCPKHCRRHTLPSNAPHTFCVRPLIVLGETVSLWPYAEATSDVPSPSLTLPADRHAGRGVSRRADMLHSAHGAHPALPRSALLTPHACYASQVRAIQIRRGSSRFCTASPASFFQLFRSPSRRSPCKVDAMHTPPSCMIRMKCSCRPHLSPRSTAKNTRAWRTWFGVRLEMRITH